MGMFSKLFGSSGSDKADKMRQQAIDAFNAIQTPELKDLQIQLDKYVQAGKLTPEEAEAQLLSSNAFNDITTDPSYTGAAKQALQQLQQIGTQGGMTAIDKAQLQDITNQQNQEAKSRNEAVMSQARERGMGGSDISTVNQLLNEQSAADRASQAGTNVAANAQQRALQAIQASGGLGQSLEGQAYGEAANKAAAQNAIDLFNKQTLNQTNLYNTQTSNAAQAANLANAQSVGNANTETGNANKEYNAAAVQQQYNDALQKANGEAGVFGQWANDATAQAAKEKAADMGITSGLLQGGATALGAAFGGPAGAAAGSTAFKPKNPTEDAFNTNYNTNNFSDGGEVTADHPEHPEHLAMGGHVHCYANGGDVHHHPDCYMSKGGQTQDFRSGGHVPGVAKVPGNSPKNDTVDAKLSPGEIVVPRSAANDDDEFNHFMEKFRPSKQPKALSPHVPVEAKALANLHTRIQRLEGGK